MPVKRFYENSYLYLSLGAVIVFVGFYNSYFSRLGQMATPYHIHGVSATLWMLLLIVQPLLYKLNRLKIHRTIGWISIVLVPMIIIAGSEVMMLMIRGQQNYPPDTVYNLAYIDFLTLAGFAVFYILAIIFRKRIRLHARFMICTIFGPLIPALTRVFFTLGLAQSFPEGLHESYLLSEAVLLFLIVRERKAPEMRVTYLPLFLFMLVQHLTFSLPNGWEWWVSWMNALAGYSPS